MRKLSISRIKNIPIKIWAAIGVLMCVAIALFGNMRILGFGSFSWQEEVLLHDGKTILVERAQRLGGRSEIGQSSPVAEHTVAFKLPNSNREVKFTAEYAEDVGRASLRVLALHIVNDVPYIVAEPTSYIAYHKWGAPSSPYVMFLYDGAGWRRIGMEKLPAQARSINFLILGDYEDYVRKIINSDGYISASEISKANRTLPDAHYREIVRETLWSKETERGPRMIRTKSGWTSEDYFTGSLTLDACVALCKREGVKSKECPCVSYFEGKNNNIEK